MASSSQDVIPKFCSSSYELRWYERANGVVAERYTNETSDGNLYEVDVSEIPIELDHSFPPAEIVRELLRRKCVPRVLGGRVIWLPPDSGDKTEEVAKGVIQGSHSHCIFSVTNVHMQGGTSIERDMNIGQGAGSVNVNYHLYRHPREELTQPIFHGEIGNLPLTFRNFMGKDKELSDFELYRNLNNFAALFTEIASKVFIERNLFQNDHFPSEVFFYFTDDLARLLSKHLQPSGEEEFFSLTKAIYLFPKETSLFKELCLLFKKYALQKELSQKEEQYLNAPVPTPVPLNIGKEILNGVKWATGVEIGCGLSKSLHAAYTNNIFRDHAPWIITCYGSKALGPFIEKMTTRSLEKTRLTLRQQIALKPWLNAFAHIALGFMPKAHGTGDFLQYQYPNPDGSFEWFSENAKLSLKGDLLLVNISREFDTPEGFLNGNYSGEFNILEMEFAEKESITINAERCKGVSVPVIFSKA